MSVDCPNLPGSGNVGAAFGREWFERHPVRVAFELIGALLVVSRDNLRVAARIVEVEAYGGDGDGASHATMYKRGRNALVVDSGALYMQFSYGMHTMTNIVAHEPGCLGAVLLRAADDPIDGIEIVRERRAPKQRQLLIGPGCLSQGMGTRLSDTLKPLGAVSGICIESGTPAGEVWASPRIGISRAADARWRFFDAASDCVSKNRRGRVVDASDLDAIIDDLPDGKLP